MKVLFVRSANTHDNGGPITNNQALSLIDEGIDVIFFNIKGKGLKGYFANISKLRKFIKQTKPDIIHAHYGLSGIISFLTFKNKKIVTSLMGSDTTIKYQIFLNRIFTIFFWNKTIVKSQKMKDQLGLKKTIIVPNGVNINKFEPIAQKKAREFLNWDDAKTIILFAANPEIEVKNFPLTQEAISLLDFEVEIKYLHNIKNEEAFYYFNAADIVVLSSFSEGSPNVIKEAMSCNCPIVTTKVGDVDWLIGTTEGCFISSGNTIDFAENIKKAIEYTKINQKTVGRDRIIELGIDSKSISQKLINIYNNLNNR